MPLRGLEQILCDNGAHREQQALAAMRELLRSVSQGVVSAAGAAWAAVPHLAGW